MIGPSISFVKAHACGNDFLMVDSALAAGQYANLTRRLCDRNRGVGADGVEWLLPARSDREDLRIRLFNADGSEAEISGNGTRCVAAYMASQQNGNKKELFMIGTAAGIKACKLVARRDNEYHFSTRMGTPQVRKDLSLQLRDQGITGVEVNIGNPHYVILGPVPENWKEIGAALTNHPHFPHGTNIEFVHVTGKDEVTFSIFERGVGPTTSSGTGSCASATAAMAMGLVKSPVVVKSEGGVQRVLWERSATEDELILEGPAEIVCSGEYFVGSGVAQTQSGDYAAKGTR